MNQLTDTIININFEDIKTTIFPKDTLFGLIIDLNDVKYEFLLNIKTGVDKIICLGSGAYPKNSDLNRTRPWFNRWSWEFEGFSTIHYNDPTLYLSERIAVGWGIGKNEDWYLENISKIIKEIIENIQIPNKNVLFYGSSAGGFTSLQLGILIKNSLVLADIPQLDLKNSYWYTIKKISFPEIPEYKIIKDYGHRVCIMDNIIKEKYVPNALIIMDCSDENDYQKQYEPFLKRLNELPYSENQNTLKFTINGKNKGHKAIDKEDILKIIQYFYILHHDGNKLIGDTQIMEENNKLSKINDNLSDLLIMKQNYIVDLKTENTELNNENNILQKDFENIKKENISKYNEQDSLMSKYNLLQNEVNTLKNNNKILNNYLDLTKEENENLKNENQKLLKINKELENKIQYLSKKDIDMIKLQYLSKNKF